LFASATTYDTSLNVSYKFMGATPDTSFTRPSTGSVADAQQHTIQVWRNVDPAIFDVTPVSATGTGVGRPNPGSITPITPGAVILICAGAAAAAAAAFVAPSGFATNFLTGRTNDTNDAVVGSGYQLGWTSGAVDPAQFTGGTTVSTASWAAYTIALRPAPTAVAPTVTTNPTNQSTTVGNTATFTAEIDGDPTPDLQWEVLGGGPSAVVLSVSNVSLTTSASQTPSVTVPAGANAFIIGSEYYSASSQSITFSGSGWMTVQASGGDWDFNWANNAYAAGKVTATGSQTLSVSATRTFDEGPTCQIIWLTVADPDDWILAHAAVPPSASPTALTLNIASETNGLVLGVFGNFSTPSVPSGATQIGSSQTTNGHTALAYSVDSVGASTTSITSASYNFPTLFGVSVKAGSVAAWENVTGGSGATTGSYTTPTATIDMDGLEYRLKGTNSAGSVTTTAATLTVTGGATYAEADITSAGVSTPTLAAGALAASVAAASGAATTTLAAGALTTATAASSGSAATSIATAIVTPGAAAISGVADSTLGAQAIAASAAASAGASTSSLVTGALVPSSVSSTGSAASTFTSSAIVPGSVSAVGVAEPTIAAASLVPAAVAIAGTSTANFEASRSHVGKLEAAAAATLSFVTDAVSASNLQVNGASTCAFATTSTFAADLVSTGGATVSLEGSASVLGDVPRYGEVLGAEILYFEILNGVEGGVIVEAAMSCAAATTVTMVGAANTLAILTTAGAATAGMAGSARAASVLGSASICVPTFSAVAIGSAAVTAAGTAAPSILSGAMASSALGAAGTVASALSTEALKDAGFSATATATLNLASGKVVQADLLADATSSVLFFGVYIAAGAFDASSIGQFNPSAASLMLNLPFDPDAMRHPADVRSMAKLPDNRTMLKLPELRDMLKIVEGRAMFVPADQPISVPADNRGMERA
jgi:hypothetical protein